MGAIEQHLTYAFGVKAAPKSNFDFPLRKSICLNNCNGNYINPAKAGDFYNVLYGHGFISQLSALNAMEDFAESFAIFVSLNFMATHFEVALPNNTSNPLDEKLNSITFREKLIFLQKQIGALQNVTKK